MESHIRQRPPPRDRVFIAIADLTTRRPGLLLALTLIVMLVSAALIPGLRLTTSRHGLVSPHNPYQARMLRFFHRFGFPNTPVVVVSGGTVAGRRATIDDLARAYQADPMFKGRVLARVGPRQVARVLLLQHPDVLQQVRSTLPAGESLVQLLNGGLPALAQTFRAQVERTAAAMQAQAMMPWGAMGQGQQDEAIRKMGNVAGAVAEALKGGDLWDALARDAEARSRWPGLDSRGYLASDDDSFNTVVLFPAMTSDEVRTVRPIVTHIRAIRDRVLQRHAGVRADVTGVPTIAVDELGIIHKGMWQSTVATTIGVLLLFLIAFRSLWLTGVSGVPLVLGLVLTLAAVRLIYGELNLITSSFISVVLGLGIDFAVHILARFNEFRRDNLAPRAAIAGALCKAGPGILTGAATTAVAFLTITTTKFTAFAELGVITALGLLFILLATFLVVPPLVMKLGSKRVPVPPELPGLHRLPTLIARIPRSVIIVGTVLAVGGIVAFPTLRFNARYFDFLPRTTESARGLRLLETDGALTPTFANLTASSVKQARQMTAAARALSNVSVVESITDLLPPLDAGRLAALRKAFAGVDDDPDFAAIRKQSPTAAQIIPSIKGIVAALNGMQLTYRLQNRSTAVLNATRDRFAKLATLLASLPDGGRRALHRLSGQLVDVFEPAWATAHNVAARGHYDLHADVPPIFQRRFVSHDGKALAVYAYPSGDVWNQDVAEKFRVALEKIDPTVSGFAITLNEHSMMILHGFERAAVFAAVLVFIMLLIDFRSFKDALLALLPVVFGWLWMLGIMGAVPLHFDVANVVVLPLLFGIGIDAGVHFIHRSRESAADNGGRARLNDLLRGTGSAVMLASLTTIVGFGGLMVADYGAMKSLGLLMVIGISSSLIACMFVLPAVLVLLGRAR